MIFYDIAAKDIAQQLAAELKKNGWAGAGFIEVDSLTGLARFGEQALGTAQAFVDSDCKHHNIFDQCKGALTKICRFLDYVVPPAAFNVNRLFHVIEEIPVGRRFSLLIRLENLRALMWALTPDSIRPILARVQPPPEPWTEVEGLFRKAICPADIPGASSKKEAKVIMHNHGAMMACAAVRALCPCADGARLLWGTVRSYPILPG